jgi:hypothetical protein
MDAKTRNSLIVFLALTFATSSIFYSWSFSGAPLNRVVPFLMWTPGLCALITQLLFHRTLAGLGWRLGPWRYLLGAALLPIGYGLAVYVPVWLLGIGQFDRSVIGKALPVLPFALAENLVFALGEEIGRRLRCRDTLLVRGVVLPDLGDGHVGESGVAAPSLRQSLDRDHLSRRSQPGHPGDFRPQHD